MDLGSWRIEIMMKAPQVLNWSYKKMKIGRLSGKGKELFDKIFELIDKIDTKDDERRISLWLSTERGTVADYEFEDDEEAILYFGVDKIEEVEPFFLEMYPSEVYWVKVDTVHNDICRYLRVNDFEIGIMDADKEWQEYDENLVSTDFLEWLCENIKQKIDEIANGQYKANLDRELPLECRFGIIPRRKYWELIPADRGNEIGRLSQEDIDKFKELYKQEGDNFFPESRIKSLTFNEYFQIVVNAYETMDIDLPKSTLKKKFESHGEDFGGMVFEWLDLDSVQDFEDFYEGKHKHGGHPWGIWRGSSRSRVMLVPKFDKGGYMFTMSGNPNWSCYEIVKMYLAFKEKGIPVRLWGFGDIVRYLEEEDLIGIVPYYRILAYCQHYFPNRKVEDFRHYHEEVKGLKEAIEWLPLNDYTLKKE